jgi:hypothetical protein
MARCGSAVHRGDRIFVPDHHLGLECYDDFILERHQYRHGIFAGVLGHPNGNPQ